MIDFLKSSIVNNPLYEYLYKLQHKSNLTVVSFHRVIGQDDPLLREANPFWTITQDQFTSFIEILKKYFSIIDPADIKYFFSGELNKHQPLIVSFDDGWRDNYLYAYPVLKRLNVKALFFIATKFVGADRYFWEESVYAKLSRLEGDERFISELAKALNIKANNHNEDYNFVCSVNHIIESLYKLDIERRNRLLIEFGLESTTAHRRVFLNDKELIDMYRNGMAIGSHGHSHAPCNAENIKDELCSSMKILNKIIGINPVYFSWPHGVYKSEFLKICKSIGLKYVFTSNSGVTKINGNQLEIKRFFIPNWRINQNKSFTLNSSRLKNLVLRDIV